MRIEPVSEGDGEHHQGDATIDRIHVQAEHGSRAGWEVEVGVAEVEEVADPLKRWVSKTDQNVNLGREFVRCSSKTLVGRDGKILKKCDHFECMDAYIERLQFEGYIDSNGAATWELNLGFLPNVMENWGGGTEP
ncbi:hypothetical protein D1007_30180 [Hordeum vulgare]|nr:hypothetical protein D1007_30180 [Hordeum vulgare]